MAKGHYGSTPWGAWFIEVLDSYKMGARLDRGRSYANTGRVLSLDINNGRVTAKVAGNYSPYYLVSISFPPLDKNEQDSIYALIEKNSALLSRIASGELPEEFLRELKAKKITLIPKAWREMKRSCSCPDDGDPCKHMAALYYLIAREVDANPRLLFTLRGIDVAARFGEEVRARLTPPFTLAFEALDAKKKTLGADAPELPSIPHCAELILSLLPSSPPFCERDFKMTLAEFYHKAARFVPWPDADLFVEDTQNIHTLQTGDAPPLYGGESHSGRKESHSARLPKYEHAFSRSRWSLHCPAPGPGAHPVLVQEDVRGGIHRHELYNAFLLFRDFSGEEGSETYRYLFYLFKLLNLLCGEAAFIPAVHVENEKLRIVWKAFDTLPLVNDALESLSRYEPGLLIRNIKKRTEYATGRSVTDLLASGFLGQWVAKNYFAYTNAGFSRGSGEYRDLLGLFFQSESIGVKTPALRSLPYAVDRWLSVLHLDFSAFTYNVVIREASHNDSPCPEGRGIDLFMDACLPASGKRASGSGTIKTPLSKVKDIAVLRAPTALSSYLPEINDLLSKPSVRLSEPRLASFLENTSELLTRLGVRVHLPKSLHRELKPRLVIKSQSAKAGTLVSYLRLDSLLDWKWQIAIGDTVMSLKEFEKLLKEKKKLIRFRDGYVQINPEELSALLKKAGGGDPGVNDFLKAHFSGDSILSFDAEQIINRLFDERSFSPPVSLHAKLRPYQERGYNWICSLLYAGFGCILADDMGLGKTVQAISCLLRLREEGLLSAPCLVVAPASLLENWERELRRFAPDLTLRRYHGAGRAVDAKSNVLLTTYQTAARDAAKLQRHNFSLLIVDEAHLMKNAETLGAKAVKQLRSQYRLALSGTPVENRLEDLRSLFDFILPGYLGSPAQFRENYRYPVEVLRQKDRAEELRRITAPFLLRRLKTDKAIISDLPEKIIVDEYAGLEKDQAALYDGVISMVMEKSSRAEAKDRAALVLTLLTSLKQICDHPRVYDKESPALSRLSGKAQLLLTLLEEILSGGEKVLIFSQYTQTLECLREIIVKELGEPCLVYHGGLGAQKRSAVIDEFQNNADPRILLISLKAGGLGLNLTAASRVIHYDLWYNPAVENQATDRCFRIGQKRRVFVHRFITKNSFEEKIDAMLRDKRELAGMSVASGESWLARMSHEELKTLFTR
ncbi:MAG: DEAD/DEAH box helicase family protein [Treponema sp.]|jgi:SNF2 family DNA or RNA helicase/uncharacterized Zn finger protein|nr:DEAD/DEAH box helicase family protein [Treponema sp.]